MAGAPISPLYLHDISPISPQQAEWQARMQRAAKDKKELKPSREEQEKGRALQREKAAKVREKHFEP